MQMKNRLKTDENQKTDGQHAGKTMFVANL